MIPADVPKKMEKKFEENYNAITKKSGRLFLFAGDQRVEHLNTDFYGKDISKDDASPEHLFKIASQARIGAFATQLGLISRYVKQYKNVDYIVKLNSKTNLIKSQQIDPVSTAWHTVNQVVNFAQNSGAKIRGVGYTVYIGSEYEQLMLHEAAQIVHQAHLHGLVAIIWIYPRGKAIKREKDPKILAGAADVGAALGADFVKINYPDAGRRSANLFKEATLAAGNTGVVCAGGAHKQIRKFLEELHDQIFISGASGNATGRNVHQRPLAQAIKFCDAIAAITIDGRSVSEAMSVYEQSL